MVRVVAEESQARTTIGILEGLSKYKEVGESGYIRVAIKIGNETKWFSHWGTIEQLEDLYKDLQIGDKVQISYTVKQGKKGKFYRILSIAPAPTPEPKAPSPKPTAPSPEPRVPPATDLENKIITIQQQLEKILEITLQLKNLVTGIYEIDIPRIDENFRRVYDKIEDIKKEIKKLEEKENK